MGRWVVARDGAGRCPGRGRRDAEVRGGLGDPREEQLGESSARPQRQAGAPGSPRAHGRQVGPGAMGCVGPRAPRAVGTVPGFCQATALTHGDKRAPGTCRRGRRGRDPAPPRRAMIAGGAGPARTAPKRFAPGQLRVPGSGRHRSACSGKVPRAQWTSPPAPRQSQGCEAPGRSLAGTTEERVSDPDSVGAQPISPPRPHLTFPTKEVEVSSSDPSQGS